MELNLKGKIALVTGGSKGIGRAVAESLADEGCYVAVVSRSVGREAHPISDRKLFWKAADLSVKDGIEETVRAVKDYWPDGIDILINNVGGGGRWSEDEWKEVYNKNVPPMVLLTRAFLPYMVAKQWGRVVTISSIYGKESGGSWGFNMAKSSQISYMKNMSMKRHYVDAGITFNSVCPGHIETGNWQKGDVFYTDNAIRFGKPEDVANLVTFLCSNKASHINGACITVDGGESMSF
jgi:3-oxoacyl-[acyl-carrier protein] reductase